MRLFAALLLLCAFAGCRDALVDAPPPEQIVPPATFQTSELYVKSAAPLRVGRAVTLRTQGLPDVARFEWSLRGRARIVGGNGEGTRFFEGQATFPGEIVVEVQALDSAGRLIAWGSREFVVSDS